MNTTAGTSTHPNAATGNTVSQRDTEKVTKFDDVVPDAGKQQISQRREKSRIDKDIDTFSQL